MKISLHQVQQLSVLLLQRTWETSRYAKNLALTALLLFLTSTLKPLPLNRMSPHATLARQIKVPYTVRLQFRVVRVRVHRELIIRSIFTRCKFSNIHRITLNLLNFRICSKRGLNRNNTKISGSPRKITKLWMALTWYPYPHQLTWAVTKGLMSVTLHAKIEFLVLS